MTVIKKYSMWSSMKITLISNVCECVQFDSLGSTAATNSEDASASGLSVLSALNLLKWKNNSVKPRMLGFKEMKRKKKDENSPHNPMESNVFQLREYFSRRW